jgi:lipopolysaccharide transport system ATP-binding protein
MMPAISVRNIGKRYVIGAQERAGRTLRETIVDLAAAPFRRLGRISRPPAPEELIWALKDVSFDVQPGEVVGVIGRNGAGKSTLLKIMSRITEPTEGRIELHGRVASLLEVGTGFHPELTGRENIYLNGTILGMKKAEIDRKFDEIVAFSEIEKFLDTPVKHYSSGMYVRLAFAVAAHLDPEILLVDEVLAVGDAEFQRKCLGKMSEVARGGRTVLFVSHNMAAVQRLCGRCVLIQDGRVAADGKSAMVLDRYLSATRGSYVPFDLFASMREQELGSYARVAKCVVSDSEGQPTSSIGFGEPFTIDLECHVLKPVIDLSFLVGIDTLYDQRIVTVTSLESHQLVSAEPGNRLKARLTVRDFLLKPGIYSLTVGLFAMNKGIDRLPGAAQFEVRNVSLNSQYIHIDQVSVGLVQMTRPDWQVTKLSGRAA